MKTKLLPFFSLLFLFIFLGIQLAVSAITSLVMILINSDMSMSFITNPTYLIITLSASAIITIAVFLITKWTLVSKNYILTRPWTVLFWSSIAALGALIPSIFIQEFINWPEWLTDMFNSEATLEALSTLTTTAGGFFVIAILQPLAEEVVFRGAILRTLLRWKPEHRWLMITLSALLFAIAHMNPMQFIHPFMVGLLLGWMYERTGSIIPGVAYHWINNSAAVVMTILYPSAGNTTEVRLSDIWGEGNVYLAVAFSLCILLPAIYQLNRTMKRAQTPQVPLSNRFEENTAV